MKNQIVLSSDPLFIKERLREIDDSYYIVYNLCRGMYEVHSSEQNDSFCFSIPFDTLDERTLELARKTRVARRDQLIAEMDRENELLQERLRKEAVMRFREVLE